MKALVFGRISVAKAGWLIVAFLIAWPVFVLMPFGREKKASRSQPDRIRPTIASKLEAVGLAPNPDWDGLPELFAVWAEHAEWKGRKTQFAFWHPGSKSYAYFFEATRDGNGFRFHEMTPKEVFAGWAGPEASGLTETSETHPFLFFHEPKLSKPRAAPEIPHGVVPGVVAPAEKVPVSINDPGK